MVAWVQISSDLDESVDATRGVGHGTTEPGQPACSAAPGANPQPYDWEDWTLFTKEGGPLGVFSSL